MIGGDAENCTLEGVPPHPPSRGVILPIYESGCMHAKKSHWRQHSPDSNNHIRRYRSKFVLTLKMHPTAFGTFIFIGLVLWTACTFSTALSCDSCGQECAAACGSRHFRTCCFNYLRKRNSPPTPVGGPINLSASPGLRLELWLAKSRASRSLLAEDAMDILPPTAHNFIVRNLEHHRQQLKDKLNLLEKKKYEIADVDFQDIADADNSSRLQLTYDA